jgi:hypothetical protein
MVKCSISQDAGGASVRQMQQLHSHLLQNIWKELM